MSEKKHMAEPLQVMFGNSNLLHIETGEGNPQGQGVPVCSMPKKQMATAERMVECYNECAGMGIDEIRAAIALYKEGDHC